MGEGSMHGLPEYFAHLVIFCADYVGRAWNRSIERHAERGIMRVGRYQVGIVIECRTARVEPGSERAPPLLCWVGEPCNEIARELGDVRIARDRQGEAGEHYRVTPLGRSLRQIGHSNPTADEARSVFTAYQPARVVA